MAFRNLPMLTSVITICCSLLALSWACCTPDQWEGYEGVVTGYSGYIKRGSIEEGNWIAYDYTNKRSAVYINYVNGDIEAKYKMIRRSGEEGGMLYVINLKKDRCWKKHVKGDFRKACIPEKSKDLGNYYLGVKGGFKVRGYFFGSEKRSYGNWLSVEYVDDKTCAPVIETVMGKIGHYKFLSTVTFADIAPGIKNETIFEVPEICEEMKDVSLIDELSREHFILAL